MRVKWSEWININDGRYNKYEGDVISSHKGFLGLGVTYLVVACTDDIVREVWIDKVTIIK